ncbi:MAG: hypothetical protein ACK2UA_03330, partial [Anaerolineae bacterium]
MAVATHIAWLVLPPAFRVALRAHCSTMRPLRLLEDERNFDAARCALRRKLPKITARDHLRNPAMSSVPEYADTLSVEDYLR